MNNSKINSKNVLIQGSILAAASILVRLIGLFYRVPLTRIVGDIGMGYYSSAFEIYNIALILSSYSLPLAVSKLVSTSLIQNDYRNAHKIFKVSLLFAAVVGLFATSVLFFVSDFYADKICGMPDANIAIKVLAPTIFVFSIMGIIRGYFQGHNNMVPTAISQIIEQIINAIISVLAAYLLIKAFKNSPLVHAYGAAGSTIGTLSGALAALITLVIIYLLYRNSIHKDILTQADYTEQKSSYILKMLILTAFPVILSQTIYQISGPLDNALFGKLMSQKGIAESSYTALWGKYSAKYKLLTNVPVAVASAMGTAVVPSLIAEFTARNYESMKQKIASVVHFNMIIAFPSAIGISVLAKPIMILLFGDSSDISANLVRIGGICVVFFALSTVTNGVLQGINRMSLPVWHSAISLIIHIPLLIFLLRFTNLGVYSLVICNVLFPLVVCALNWFSIYKYADYRQEINKTFIKPLIASIIMGVFAYLAYIASKPLGNLISTCISLLFAVIIYFFVLIKINGITKEELLKMRKGRLLVRFLTKLKLLKKLLGNAMANVIIIGAGPAGLMSAITAANNNHQVIVIDKEQKAGKKLFATGNGRCNFTHDNLDGDVLYGDEKFIDSVLNEFNNEDLIKFFRNLGVLERNINGYIYPRSESAASIVDVLLSECNRLGVKIILNEFVKSLDFSKGIKVFTKDNFYEADKAIIAVGGKSNPKLGSDGSLYKEIERLGHKFTPVLPGLCSLIPSDKALSTLAGSRVKCKVSIYGNSIFIKEEEGEIIFNKENINGIPIMQLSRYASLALLKKEKVSLDIDFIPDMNKNELYEFLSYSINSEFGYNKSLYNILEGLLPAKLVDYLIKKSGFSSDICCSNMNASKIRKIVNNLKVFEVDIINSSGFENSQVSVGGIDLSLVDFNMKSKIINNLYFAGEVLNVDGTCGGYNLQWAFSTGYIAGMLR